MTPVSLLHVTTAVAVAALLALAACNNPSGGEPAASGSATSGASPTAAKPAAPAPVPTPTTAAGGPGAIGRCSILGSWEARFPPGPFPFSNTPITFTWNPDGTGMSKSLRADTQLAWSISGDSLTFHGVKDETNPGRFTCRTADASTSRVEMSPDCGTMTFHVTADPCVGRRQQIDGMVAHRKG